MFLVQSLQSPPMFPVLVRGESLLWHFWSVLRFAPECYSGKQSELGVNDASKRFYSRFGECSRPRPRQFKARTLWWESSRLNLELAKNPGLVRMTICQK